MPDPEEPYPVVSALNPDGKWYGPPRLVEQVRGGDYGRFPKRAPLPATRLKATALQTVCQGRNPCRQIADQHAGTDARGRVLRVVGISLFAKPHPPPLDPNEPCEPIEHWLVILEKERVVEADLLLKICNDGYGSAGVGEDWVEVTENHFRHNQSGGSAWRWHDSLTIELLPRRVAATGSGTYWSGGFSQGMAEWDWRTFAGKESVAVPPCTPEGTAPDEWKDSFESAWVSIPAVATPPGFARSQWKGSHLGRCAVSVSGQESQGYVTHGHHGGPRDATLKVVGLHDGTFVVEVTDDHFVFDAERPLLEDHLELWAASGPPPDPGEFCEPPTESELVQWGIRLKDGAVFAGFGSPGSGTLTAEVSRRRDSVVVKLKPKALRELVTVVYSDSDDGKTQGALIATSRLAHGRRGSLGRRRYIHPEAAHCEVREGELTPILE